MAPKRFKSKIDRWLLYLLIAVMVFEVVVMSAAAMLAGGPLEATFLVLAALVIVGLLGSMLVGTHYTVDGNTLRIACGPFRWKVPIDAIESVEPSRNPLSSPALSLDRLRIQYGKRRILVSPADKAGFLRAIGQEPADARR
ncbi:MAG TPA: PH domain-containing protein [Woeseiaceae bacterium]|nr:PH domain-containing protein [Woeseiaceae bacterium]